VYVDKKCFMEAKHIERVNFYEAFLGLILTPGATTELLLKNERPRYGISILSLLLFILLAPVVVQTYRYQFFVNVGHSLLSLLLLIVLTCLLFVLMEWLFLNILRMDVTPHHVMTITAYSTAPIILGIWLIYLFNYLTEGDISVITMFLTGYTPANDQFLQILPATFVLIQLYVLLVFYYSLKNLGDLDALTAVILTVLSLFPFFLSILIAAFIGEGVRPGTVDILIMLISR